MKDYVIVTDNTCDLDENTYPIWKDINNEITKVLNSKTLADYIEGK